MMNFAAGSQDACVVGGDAEGREAMTDGGGAEEMFEDFETEFGGQCE